MTAPRRPRRRTRAGHGLALVLLALATGCGERENPLDRSPEAIAPAIREAPPEGPAASASLTVERIGNANVSLPIFAGERVAMRGGSFERQSPFRVVLLQDGLLEVADFDEDGAPEAAVVISVVEGTPAPGQPAVPQSYLVLYSGSQPLQEAALQLPSRSRVAAVRTRAGILELDLVTFAPGDRPCCPTGRETRRYRYSGGNFTQF